MGMGLQAPAGLRKDTRKSYGDTTAERKADCDDQEADVALHGPACTMEWVPKEQEERVHQKGVPE